MNFMAKKVAEIVPHSANSPDLALSNFFLHPESQKPLQRQKFADWNVVINVV